MVRGGTDEDVDGVVVEDPPEISGDARLARPRCDQLADSLPGPLGIDVAHPGDLDARLGGELQREAAATR
jgi:hypothetical protein